MRLRKAGWPSYIRAIYKPSGFANATTTTRKKTTCRYPLAVIRISPAKEARQRDRQRCRQRARRSGHRSRSSRSPHQFVATVHEPDAQGHEKHHQCDVQNVHVCPSIKFRIDPMPSGYFTRSKLRVRAVVDQSSAVMVGKAT